MTKCDPADETSFIRREPTSLLNSDSLMADLQLSLRALAAGFKGITPVWGASLAEAAGVSLHAQGHRSPKEMGIFGALAQSTTVIWEAPDAQQKRTWNDLQEAAEHGAYGIAALLIDQHTSWEVVERSRKGTGFDYWLGPKGDPDDLFQNAARLEVSGILSGQQSQVNARVRQKLAQIDLTNVNLPGYVVVVEFGTPLSMMAIK